ncbi:hypothetical protein [Sphingomonas sp. NBWT7]|uniref:hypothetical protein n=1 Tax=Sphingomonas sp. NBWT7 TaxID=2596913 RepID=UPI00162833AC|nr:hypothetical protein [Sphingomonas sp. NBWT7]
MYLVAFYHGRCLGTLAIEVGKAAMQRAPSRVIGQFRELTMIYAALQEIFSIFRDAILHHKITEPCCYTGGIEACGGTKWDGNTPRMVDFVAVARRRGGTS